MDGTHDTTAVVVRHFEVDRDGVYVIELEHCVLGERMRLQAVVNGPQQPWHTTDVLSIAKHAAT